MTMTNQDCWNWYEHVVLLFPLSCEKYSAEIIILQVSLDMALKEGKTQKSRRVFETNCSKQMGQCKKTIFHQMCIWLRER